MSLQKLEIIRRRLTDDEGRTEAIKHFAWLDSLKKGQIPDYPLDPRALPSSADKRVFIGGSYQFVPLLRHIQRVVALQDFMPIFLGDFEIGHKDTYEVAMGLLRECKHAIFDVSLDSGHLLEVHEAKQRGINFVMIYMASNWRKDRPKGSTSMVHSMNGHRPIGYQTFGEMEKLVIDFLKSCSTS